MLRTTFVLYDTARRGDDERLAWIKNELATAGHPDPHVITNLSEALFRISDIAARHVSFIIKGVVGSSVIHNSQLVNQLLRDQIGTNIAHLMSQFGITSDQARYEGVIFLAALARFREIHSTHPPIVVWPNSGGSEAVRGMQDVVEKMINAHISVPRPDVAEEGRPRINDPEAFEVFLRLMAKRTRNILVLGDSVVADRVEHAGFQAVRTPFDWTSLGSIGDVTDVWFGGAMDTDPGCDWLYLRDTLVRLYGFADGSRLAETFFEPSTPLASIVLKTFLGHRIPRLHGDKITLGTRDRELYDLINGIRPLSPDINLVDDLTPDREHFISSLI